MRLATIALVAAAVFISCAQDESSSRPVASAPDFTVTTFEGPAFDLSDHLGTPVVINFWESW